MDISDVMLKLELRHLVGLLFPGMLFSITILYAVDKLYCYTLLLTDFTSVNSAYVSLLLFYLLASGLVFGICFQLLYLWYFQKPFRALRKLWEKILKDNKKDEKQEVDRSTPCNNKEDPYDVTKCPAEFTDILLKAVNIDIDYKALYRILFGNLYVSIFLSALVLILVSWYNSQKNSAFYCSYFDSVSYLFRVDG